MSEHTVVHSTITIERSYPASPRRVYAAWADPKLKQRWFPAGEGAEVLEFTMDFRVGGRDVSAMRVPGGFEYRNDTVYLDLVPDQRIVSAYTMFLGERRISASLATVELRPDGEGTRLVFTEQAAFFAGADGPQRREHGWRELFGRLAAELAAPR